MGASGRSSASVLVASFVVVYSAYAATFWWSWSWSAWLRPVAMLVLLALVVVDYYGKDEVQQVVILKAAAGAFLGAVLWDLIRPIAAPAMPAIADSVWPVAFALFLTLWIVLQARLR